MNEKLIRMGFYAGGMVNIVGILTITRGMTSETLAVHDPAVFSQFGILMIMVWGMAYIATAPFASSSVLIPLTFALEKLAYTVNWGMWISDHGDQVTAIRESDFLGGFFLAGYGVNDGLFCLFFAAVAYTNWQRSRSPSMA